MIKIRKAGLKDIRALVEMWEEFEKEHDEMVLKRDLSLKELLKKKPNARAVYIKYLKKAISKKGIVLIAEADKKAIGYLEGSIKKNDLFARRLGSIWDLFVRKGFRKQGISSMLKDRAIFLFRKKGVKFSEMYVHVSNTNAHQIYRKWGFYDESIRMMKKL